MKSFTPLVFFTLFTETFIELFHLHHTDGFTHFKSANSAVVLFLHAMNNIQMAIYTVSKKNNTDVAHYNLNAH